MYIEKKNRNRSKKIGRDNLRWTDVDGQKNREYSSEKRKLYNNDKLSI